MDPFNLIVMLVLFVLLVQLWNSFARNSAKIAQLESTVEFLKKNAGVEFAPDEALKAKIVEELVGGNKIKAIKLHRETMGSGLKDAKDFVEEIQRTLEDDA